MKFSLEKILKAICLCLVLLLPVATYAAPTGEIIFRYPEDYRELWIGNVNDGRSAQPLFRLPHDITAFSIQKDGRYIVVVVQIKAKMSSTLFMMFTYLTEGIRMQYRKNLRKENIVNFMMQMSHRTEMWSSQTIHSLYLSSLWNAASTSFQTLK